MYGNLRWLHSLLFRSSCGFITNFSACSFRLLVTQVLPAIGHLMIGRSNVDKFLLYFLFVGTALSIPVDIALQWFFF